MGNRTEPAQHRESGQTPVSQSGFYIVCCQLTWAMLLLTGVSLILSCMQAPAWVIWLENALRKLLPPSAMAAVAELAGLPGVIFSGLLSRLGDQVCGVKMPDLIQDKYPHFFRLCFGFFIIFSLAAALAGSNNLFWPTLYAFCGVIIAIGWICRICYIFLIKTDSQVDLAFRYYEQKLRDSRKSPPENEPAGEKPEEGKDSGWALRRHLLNTAGYARMLLLQEYQDHLRQTVQIWMDVFSDRSMPEWDENTYFAPDHYIFQDCSLAASAWSALLPDGPTASHDVKILHSMLDYLDASLSGQDEERYTYNREVLLLGLAQFLMEVSKRGDEQEVKRLCSLTDGRQDHSADQDLIYACLMMRTVEWLENSASAEDDLACAIYCLQPLIDNILFSVQPQTERPHLAEYLHCAESMTCHAHGMTPGELLQRIQGRLESRQETYNMFSYLSRKGYRSDLLGCFLQQISASKTSQRKKSSASTKSHPAKATRRDPTTPMAKESSVSTSMPAEDPAEPAVKKIPADAKMETTGILKEDFSEDITVSSPEESSGEEVPDGISEEPSTEEIPAEASEDTLNEETPAEISVDVSGEEVLAGTLEEPSIEETSAQAAMSLDKVHKKEV